MLNLQFLANSFIKPARRTLSLSLRFESPQLPINIIEFAFHPIVLFTGPIIQIHLPGLGERPRALPLRALETEKGGTSVEDLDPLASLFTEAQENLPFPPSRSHVLEPSPDDPRWLQLLTMPLTDCKFVWKNGRIISWTEATIHVSCHGLHYGTGVFEGIRCYETPGGPAVFRLGAHIDRWFSSARIYGLAWPYSRHDLAHAVLEVIRANRFRQC